MTPDSPARDQSAGTPTASPTTRTTCGMRPTYLVRCRAMSAASSRHTWTPAVHVAARSPISAACPRCWRCWTATRWPTSDEAPVEPPPLRPEVFDVLLAKVSWRRRRARWTVCDSRPPRQPWCLALGVFVAVGPSAVGSGHATPPVIADDDGAGGDVGTGRDVHPDQSRLGHEHRNDMHLRLSRPTAGVGHDDDARRRAGDGGCRPRRSSCPAGRPGWRRPESTALTSGEHVDADRRDRSRASGFRRHRRSFCCNVIL